MDIEEAKQRVLQAAGLYQSNRFEECLEVLDPVHIAFPDDKRVIYNKGMCLAKLGRLIDATACCDEVEDHLPKEHVESLRRAISSHQTPVPQAPVMPSEAPSASEERATPVPQEPRKPVGPRFDLRPLATLAPEGPWPLLLEWGFVEMDDGGTGIPGAAALDDTKALNEDGWRCFIALIDRLLECLARKEWFTAPNIPDDVMKRSLALYERVFTKGELVVAVRDAKQPIMVSDRHLYCTRADKDMLPTAAPWEGIEAVESMPTGRERITQIRLRSGQRVPMSLKGMADLATPFAEFLHEVSLLHEHQGTSIVVFPLKTDQFNVPEFCCNCLSREVSKTAGFTVKDPGAPMIPQSQASGEQEKKGRFDKLSQGVTSLVGRALRRGEGAWDDGVEVYVSSDPGVTFRSCPYCTAEAPVRISRVGDLFKVFVFQNNQYAERFKRANEPGSPTD